MKADIDHLLRTALDTRPHPDPQIHAFLCTIALDPAARARAARAAIQRYADDPLVPEEIGADARAALDMLACKHAQRDGSPSDRETA